MKLDLTPWARQQLAPELMAAIRIAEPTDGQCHIGKARDDWQAVATLRGHVLANVRGRTADIAAQRLLLELVIGGSETAA